MRIVPLYPGSFAANSYLLEDDGHALIVDPSSSASSILRRIQADGCVPDGILLTHGHFDHILSIDTLRLAVPGLPLYIHRADAPMLTDGDKNAFTAFFGQSRTWQEADAELVDGQMLRVGQATVRVLHTPGHSPGSVCFLCEAAHALLTGDTLFADNVGRCDLWGGDMATLRRSLAALGRLDGTLTIYPGHGEDSRLSDALSAIYLC